MVFVRECLHSLVDAITPEGGGRFVNNLVLLILVHHGACSAKSFVLEYSFIFV